MLIPALASLVMVATTNTQQEPVEAADAFLDRQADLIDLATQLGALHRLRQVCGEPYDSNMFRIRMKELVPLEAPMGRTRLDMITGFNAGYREASNLYMACSNEVEKAYVNRAERALKITDRLYAPFRK